MKTLPPGTNLAGAQAGKGVNMDVIAAALRTAPPAAAPPEPEPLPGQQRKYGNRVSEEDGHTFASAKEHRRYRVLRTLEAHGGIIELEVHPVYEFWVGGELVYTYTADFRYLDPAAGALVVEDVKSWGTVRKDTFRIIRNLMRALWGQEITVPDLGRKPKGRQ